jgi:hypothetical protein
MDTIINSITSNKVLLVIVILSVSLIIYSVLKRLLKIILITIIALVLYVSYVNYKGEKIDERIQQFYLEGMKKFNEIQQKQEHINRINDSINKLQK